MSVRLPLYPALFLTTLSTLMFEVLLPRIFSVTMFYHYAFMAISIAMFGMTLGAVIVFLRPGRYLQGDACRQMALNSLLFSFSIVLSFLLYLRIPFADRGDLGSLLGLAAIYALISVPFLFCGIAVAAALTAFPQKVSALYCADLVGAAAGCVLLIGLLEVADAPSAVLITAAVAGAGAYLFSLAADDRRLRGAALAWVLLLAAGSAGHALLAARGQPPVRITHRAFPDLRVLYQRWNSYSYVEVTEDLLRGVPFSWGSTSGVAPDFRIRQYAMNIDVKAGTWITEFDGDTEPLGFLAHDITNVAHHIRRQADVCVIGAGGGRDILTALYFDQRSVTAIEVNENVDRALNQVFGDFSGHLDRRPGVDFVVDEARSYLARNPGRYDIIQLSLIDTFAATAAGAFVLAENSLYTVEAWKLFLDRLRPGGIFSVSRYYFHRSPAEAYRLLSLAVAALRERGIDEPRRHLVLLKTSGTFFSAEAGVGTLLVSSRPFGREDLLRLSRVADEMRFEPVLTPEMSADRVVETIAAGGDLDAFYRGFELDISPPTDDRPFFFQMLRLRDVLDPARWHDDDVNWKNMKAALVLGVLLCVVALFSLFFLLLPLYLARRRLSPRGAAPHLFFFLAIGFGFMFIEVAQMQRFTIYLGHPSYSLSVVLFTLLLSGGLGSLATTGLLAAPASRLPWLAFPALLLVLLLVGAATPAVLALSAGAGTHSRILVAAGLLAPAGFLMGMPFPLGIRRAAAAASHPLLPWLWGVNGAASVFCSVLAAAVAITAGISFCYWAGVSCYAVALLAYSIRAFPGTSPSVG
jgi:hypothetical protein